MSENGTEVMVVDNTTQPTSLSPVDVEGAVDFWHNYQELTERLLDADDYQGTQFKKKSAWRKYATAFNLSDEIIKEEELREPDTQQIITSKVWVRVTAPNGRQTVGVGICSIFDKITKKDTTQPSNFILRQRFSNAEHDVPSTAHTRAKNRAISDMIGAGEVSAEELDPKVMKQNNARRRKKVAKPQSKEDTDKEIIEAELVKEEEELAKLEAEALREMNEAPKKSSAKKTRKTKKTNEKVEDEVIDVDVTAGDWLKRIKDHIISRGIEANDTNIKQCIESFFKKGEFDEDMKNRILKQL